MSKLLVFVVASLTLLAPCPLIAADTEKPPQVIQAFLVDKCPSDIPANGATPNALGIVSTLIGLGVDKVLDAFGKSLTEAAEKDEKGVAKTARIPAYLYEVNSTGATGKFAPRLMTCIVVAKAPSGPSSWCSDTELGKLPACSNLPEAAQFKGILKPIAGADPPLGIGAPTFYSEIRLEPSTDQRGFIPVLNALYYPESVNSEEPKFKGTAKRDLSITVSASTPGGESALSAVNIHLKQVMPGPHVLRRNNPEDDKVLRNTVTPMWVGIAKTPTYKSPPGLPDNGKGDYDNRAFPVNLTIELREIGDPRKYLKLLADLFVKYKGQLAEELKSHTPDAMEAADQKEALAELDSVAKYQATIADAYKAIAALDTACEKPAPSSPESGRSAVLQNLYAAAAAVGAVRKIEAASSMTAAPKFKVEPLPDTTKPAFDICQKVK